MKYQIFFYCSDELRKLFERIHENACKVMGKKRFAGREHSKARTFRAMIGFVMANMVSFEDWLKKMGDEE